jgi:DNA polymerase
MEQKKILKKIYNWLLFQKEMGVQYVHASEEVRNFMAMSMNNDVADQFSSLAELKRLADKCTGCALHESRISVVFGEGPEDARILVVGEAPGKEENIQGRPFVGPSGELLTKMLKAIRLSRNDIYITSVLKCRPPKNRTPHHDEISACSFFLKEQIKLISPLCILALGQVAAHFILDTKVPLKDIRGKIHLRRGIKVVATYHPAYLLRFKGERQHSLKKEAWIDLQLLEKIMHEDENAC